MRYLEINTSVIKNLFELQLENSSVEKKSLAFVGKYPWRSKIVSDTKSRPIDQVSYFLYFDCDITDDLGHYVAHTLVTFQSIC